MGIFTYLLTYTSYWCVMDTGGGIHPQFIPYSQLTDDEKRVDRDRAQELMRYMQTSGFRIIGYSPAHLHVD